jgi:aminotransferase EvaB
MADRNSADDGAVSHVRFSPLSQQFVEPDAIFEELRELVRSGDFTLGKPVGEFEAMFATAVGTKHAIGVGSGTDALKIPLKALGIGPGDEVLTAANTFYASVGAIVEVGATPRFVDCDDNFCMDVDQLEAAITSRTKALMPIHLTGDVADMPRIMEIAARHGLPVVEAARACLASAPAPRLADGGLLPRSRCIP